MVHHAGPPATQAQHGSARAGGSPLRARHLAAGGRVKQAGQRGRRPRPCASQCPCPCRAAAWLATGYRPGRRIFGNLVVASRDSWARSVRSGGLFVFVFGARPAVGARYGLWSTGASRPSSGSHRAPPARPRAADRTVKSWPRPRHPKRPCWWRCCHGPWARHRAWFDLVRTIFRFVFLASYSQKKIDLLRDLFRYIMRFGA